MQQKQQGFDEKSAWNILWAVAVFQATCVTLFTRVRVGSNALGIPALGALILMWFWMLSTHSLDIATYGATWLFALVVHRVWWLKEWWKGARHHSQYSGYPFWFMWLAKDERVAKLLEGVTFCLVGWVVDRIDWPVGHFCMASGAAILIVELVQWFAAKKVVQTTVDAQIQGEWLATQLQGRR